MLRFLVGALLLFSSQGVAETRKRMYQRASRGALTENGAAEPFRFSISRKTPERLMTVMKSKKPSILAALAKTGLPGENGDNGEGGTKGTTGTSRLPESHAKEEESMDSEESMHDLLDTAKKTVEETDPNGEESMDSEEWKHDLLDTAKKTVEETDPNGEAGANVEMYQVKFSKQKDVTDYEASLSFFKCWSDHDWDKTKCRKEKRMCDDGDDNDGEDGDDNEVPIFMEMISKHHALHLAAEYGRSKKAAKDSTSRLDLAAEKRAAEQRVKDLAAEQRNKKEAEQRKELDRRAQNLAESMAKNSARRNRIAALVKTVRESVVASLIRSFTGHANNASIKKNNTHVHFAQLDDAICRCGKKLKSFDRAHCSDAIKNAEQVNSASVQNCLAMWMELNHKSPFCTCPVSQTYGTCGVPVHLDLRSGKSVNGMSFEMLTKPDSRENIMVQGLEDPQHANFVEWVTNTTRENARIVNGVMVWEGIIPPEQGEHIRNHCNRMTWSVHKAGLVVRFDGLTYGVDLARGKRRRLLWRSRTGC